MSSAPRRKRRPASFKVPPCVRRDPRGRFLEVPLRERLLAKVNKTSEGCWLWLGVLSVEFGYGRIYHDGQMRKAHRVSYELFVGPIPDGAVLRHTCDVKPCIAPDHLRPGTQSENIQEWHDKRVAEKAVA